MELLFPLLIVFMIGMIFVSNRARKKQAAQQESLQNALAVGDIVVMTSGVSGTIVDVDDERTVDVEIAPDVVTTWLRAAVREKIGGELTDATDDTAGTGTADGSDVADTAATDTTATADTTGGSDPTRAEAERTETAPALDATAATAGNEGTAEGTRSARTDEPTGPRSAGARSTTGG